MKYRLLILTALLFWTKNIFAHDIDDISITDIEKINNEFHVKINIHTEYLKQSGLKIDPEIGFQDYLRKPFDSNITTPLSDYIDNNFSIVINTDTLTHGTLSVVWVEESKFSDHSMITVRMIYKSKENKKIKNISIKNSFLTNAIQSQKNIVYVSAENKSTSLLFTNDNKTSIVNY